MHAGIAGGADVILIPEIPYSIDAVAAQVKNRDDAGRPFTIIAVTEGAVEKGGSAVVGKVVEDSPDSIRFGGVAAKIANQLESLVRHEVRHCVLGHLQRSGDTSPADRLLSARYGVKAAEMIRDGHFGNMACLANGEMSYVSLEKVIGDAKVSTGGAKNVDPNGELVRVAKAMGITFADA